MLSIDRAPGQGFQLLPFLDLVFALMGIFLVVFVLQSVYEEPRAGLAGVDELIVCEDGQRLALYTDPQSAPLAIPAPQLREIFQHLPGGESVRNLSFAFSADCFATKRGFQRAFGEFSQQPGRAGRATRRLNFRPLGSEAGAAQGLLARWRRERAAP